MVASIPEETSRRLRKILYAQELRARWARGSMYEVRGSRFPQIQTQNFEPRTIPRRAFPASLAPQVYAGILPLLR